jgi:dihydroflavonol-4-reductase
MKIAITGASGHLGTAILQELLKRNHEIKALVKDDARSLEGLPIEIIPGDILDPVSLQKMMNNCEALIHSAAVISINGDPGGIVYRTNVEGTKLVMQTAKQAGIKRVIHISSIHAYEQHPMFETLDENRGKVNEPAFAYDRSKKLGQEIALSMNQPGMEVLVMNPTSIVGPYDHKPSKFGKVLIDLYTGRLPFIFNGGFDFCDCRDVAGAIVNGLTMGRPGENYLLSGKWYNIKEVAAFISTATGKNIKPIALPAILGKAGLPFVKLISWINKKEPVYTTEALAAIFKGNRCISSAKAMNELNYKVRPFEETIRDAFLWFENKGYLV